jgi:4-amino-4-deoxy-L-arabinose transferase-like glycosyltransferase
MKVRLDDILASCRYRSNRQLVNVFRWFLITVLGLYLPTSKLAKRGWFLLFLTIAAFYLYGLGFLPLVGPDEPRYAQIAREMFIRRDFITPTLGGMPWFEKPPLLYWMMMASYRIFGISEFSARLGPALCGLATAAFVWWLARSAGNTGLRDDKNSEFSQWSALVFLSSLGTIIFSRADSFDIVLTMTLMGALASFFVWHIRDAASSQRKDRPILLLAFYFFMGLSLLAKGLVGPVIGFAIIGVYLTLRREWSRAFLKTFWWGALIIVAVAGLWYGPMIYRHGWPFFNQFIVQHHFERFLTNKYHHPQPFYFYVPILALFTLPWSVFLAGSVSSMQFRDLRDDSPRSRLRQFSIIVIALVVLPFSLSGSKLPAYILPALPMAALLVADRLMVFRLERRGEVFTRITGFLFISVAVGAAWYSSRVGWLPKSCVIGGVAVAAVVGLFALIFPRRRAASYILFACCAIGITGLAIHCSKPVAARESVRDLVETASARGYGKVPIVGLHTVERSAEFYAAGRLVYGSDGEPIKFEGAHDVIESTRRAGGLTLCFVPVEYESQLTSYPGVHTEILGNNGRVSLMVVRAP